MVQTKVTLFRGVLNYALVKYVKYILYKAEIYDKREQNRIFLINFVEVLDQSLDFSKITLYDRLRISLHSN